MRRNTGSRSKTAPTDGSGAPLPILERAYQLARTGDYAKVSEIKQRLKAEGYTGIEAQIAGLHLRSELTRLCKAARAPKT